MLGLLNSPEKVLLAAALLFGAGLGFGAASGKGWLLWQRLRNGGKPNEIQQMRNLLHDMVPCKYHSGLEANIKHLLRETAEIKATLGDIWSSINELRRNFYVRRGE